MELEISLLCSEEPVIGPVQIIQQICYCCRDVKGYKGQYKAYP